MAQTSAVLANNRSGKRPGSWKRSVLTADLASLVFRAGLPSLWLPRCRELTYGAAMLLRNTRARAWRNDFHFRAPLMMIRFTLVYVLMCCYHVLKGVIFIRLGVIFCDYINRVKCLILFCSGVMNGFWALGRRWSIAPIDKVKASSRNGSHSVDWGEPFVKACYHLESDGPLTLECCEVINIYLSFSCNWKCTKCQSGIPTLNKKASNTPTPRTVGNLC